MNREGLMLYTRGGLHVAYEQFLCSPPGSQRKKNNMDVMCTFATVLDVGVAQDKNRNSFLVCGGKKVAHHCFIHKQFNTLSRTQYYI